MGAVLVSTAIGVAVAAMIAFAVMSAAIRRDDIADVPSRSWLGLAARLARRVTGMRPLPPFDQGVASGARTRARSRRDQQAHYAVRAGQGAAGSGAARPARCGVRP
jgi:hypothetical protein